MCLLQYVIFFDLVFDLVTNFLQSQGDYSACGLTIRWAVQMVGSDFFSGNHGLLDVRLVLTSAFHIVRKPEGNNSRDRDDVFRLL